MHLLTLIDRMGATGFLESADNESGARVSQEGSPNATVLAVTCSRGNTPWLLFARLEQRAKIRTSPDGREGGVGRQCWWH